MRVNLGCIKFGKSRKAEKAKAQSKGQAAVGLDDGPLASLKTRKSTDTSAKAMAPRYVPPQAKVSPPALFSDIITDLVGDHMAVQSVPGNTFAGALAM